MHRHAVPHDLGRDKAKEATVAAMKEYAEEFSEYHPEARWLNDYTAEISFSIKGLRLKGRIEVLGKSVDMDLNVPLLLRPFKGKALAVIEREVRKWIAKAKAGEI